MAVHKEHKARLVSWNQDQAYTGLFQIHFSENKDRNSGADVMDNITKVGCGRVAYRLSPLLLTSQ